MITLNISDKDITSGSVPLSWCLDHESVKDIMERYETDPTVVIIVAPREAYSKRKENRYVLPLKDLMTYISFRRPGNNRIFAMVFNRSIKKMKAKYLHKDNNQYVTDILNYEGTDFADEGDPYYRQIYELSVIRTTLDVEVPLEAFAPEPPQWQKDWVLWLVKDKGLDQCDFRRKKIFAFTIQPIIFALNYLFKVIATLISAAFLLKSCSLKHLRHPLDNDLADLFEIFRGRPITLGKLKSSDWDTTKPSTVTLKNALLDIIFFIKRYSGLLVMPAILIPVVVLTFLLGFKIVVTLLLSIIGFGLFILSASLLLIFLAVKLANLPNRSTKSKKEKEKEKSIKPIFSAQEVEFIVCNPVNTQPSYVKVEALPAPKRSIKLRFQQLKSKVCRPFPG